MKIRACPNVTTGQSNIRLLPRLVMALLAASILSATGAYAVVPPGADAAPECSGGSAPLPKRIWVCGSDFAAWDAAFLFPSGAGSGYWISGFSNADDGSLSFLANLDAQGNTTSRITSPLLDTTLVPTMTGGVFLAYQDVTGSSEATFGLFNTTSGFPAVFQHKMALDADESSVSPLADGRLLVTQDLGAQVEVMIFNANGTVAWAKRFASGEFGFSGGFPSPFDSQSVSVDPLSDGSFILEVAKTTLNIATFTPEAETHLVKLSATGAVEWAKTYGGVSAAASVVEFAPGTLIVSSSSLDLLNPSGPRDNVIAKLDLAGAKAWSKTLSGPSLFPVAPLPGGALLMSGILNTGEGTQGGSAIVVIGTDGSLQAQTSFSIDDQTFAIPAVDGGSIWLAAATAQAGASEDDDPIPGNPYIGLTDATLGTIQWKKYNRTADFAMVAPRSGGGLVASFFNRTDRAVEAFTFNADFSVNAGCALLEDATVTASNPGLTIADATVTLTDFTVTAEDFVPALLPGDLTFESFTTSEENLCEASGGDDVAPGFTAQPSSLTVDEGQNATFTVAVSGSPAPSVKWQRSTNSGASWSNLDNGTIGASGTTTTTLALTGVAAALSGNQFRAVATNTAGTLNSAAATLTVTPGAPPPAVVASAATVTGGDAFTANWSAVAGATGYRIDVATDAGFATFVAGYQNRDAGGATSLDISGLPPGTYYYRVRAYNNFGTGVSSATIAISVGGRFVNLSTRAMSLGGDGVIIPGFVIQGSGTKRVLIRAVGPKLQDFGISKFLPDPLLLVYLSQGAVNTLVATNGDWVNQELGLPNPAPVGDQVGAFALTADVDFPTNDTLSAALVLDLPAGSYSTVARDAQDRTGIGIVEVYDVDGGTPGGPRLVNMSNRGFVGIGGEIMIPGFVVEGPGIRRYLIRAVGPKLADFGLPVNSLLADPRVSVRKGEVEVAANDDWGVQTGEGAATPVEVAAVTTAVGGFSLEADAELPSNDEKSAALVVWLEPGAYTVVVSGAGGGTGIVIAEVYEVP